MFKCGIKCYQRYEGTILEAILGSYYVGIFSAERIVEMRYSKSGGGKPPPKILSLCK